MLKILIRWIINFRMSLAIERDKRLNQWNDEKIAKVLCYSVENFKKLQRNPASVPARELYSFIRLCLDPRSQEAIEFLSIDMQFWSYRLKIPALIKLENTIINGLKRSIPKF